MSFSKPWGLGCAAYQYEQQWFVGLAYDRTASSAVMLLIRRVEYSSSINTATQSLKFIAYSRVKFSPLCSYSAR